MIDCRATGEDFNVNPILAANTFICVIPVTPYIIIKCGVKGIYEDVSNSINHEEKKGTKLNHRAFSVSSVPSVVNKIDSTAEVAEERRGHCC